jgi:MFS family permease
VGLGRPFFQIPPFTVAPTGRKNVLAAEAALDRNARMAGASSKPHNSHAPAIKISIKPIYGVLAASVVGTASSFALHLVNLRMQSLAIDPSLISLSVAFQAAAICATAWFLRDGIFRGGLRLATILSVVSSTIVLPAIYFASDAWTFIFMRVLFGMCLTASVISAEYLVTLRTNETKNTQLIAWFTASLGAGALVGPAIISLAGVSELHSFLIGASLFLIGGALLLMSLPARAGKSHRPGTCWDTLSFMPATCAAALLFGVVDSTALSLLPLYGSLQGFSISAAANLAVCAALGAIVLQFPIAWLSTGRDTRHVLIGICVLAIIAMASMPLAIQFSMAAYLASFVLGGLVEGLFTVTLIRVSRDRRKSSIAQINACLIAMGSFGEVIGPTASSVALEYAGASGIIIVTVTAFASLALPLMLPYVRLWRPKNPVAGWFRICKNPEVYATKFMPK